MLSADFLHALEHALRDLQYGSIHLVIHEAQIVRIERIERTRLTVSPEAIDHSLGQPTASMEVRHLPYKEG